MRFWGVLRTLLAMILGAYVGFARLYHLRFIALDPILVGY
jgi:hypothetical protein